MRKNIVKRGRKKEASPAARVLLGSLAACGMLGLLSGGAALMLHGGKLPLDCLRWLGPALYGLAVLLGAWLAAGSGGEGRLLRALGAGAVCLGLVLTGGEFIGSSPRLLLLLGISGAASLTACLLGGIKRRTRYL